MKNKDTEQVVWSNTMHDRRKNDRRNVDKRRKMSGEKNVLKVPDVRQPKERRNTDRRRTVKLTITGRAVEVSAAKDKEE